MSLYLCQDRVPGEPFVAKPSKDAEMDKILRSMQVSFDDFIQSCPHTIKQDMNIHGLILS